MGGRVTHTRRPGSNVDAERDQELTVGAPRLLPMDVGQRQRAVAALAAALIPLVRDVEDAVIAVALDTAGDVERSSDHADQ